MLHATKPTRQHPIRPKQSNPFWTLRPTSRLLLHCLKYISRNHLKRRRPQSPPQPPLSARNESSQCRSDCCSSSEIKIGHNCRRTTGHSLHGTPIRHRPTRASSIRRVEAPNSSPLPEVPKRCKFNLYRPQLINAPGLSVQ